MKLSLNLARRQNVLSRYAAFWALPLFLLSVLGGVRLVSSLRLSARQYVAAHRAAAKEEAALDHLRAQEQEMQRKLNQPQYREFIRQAAFVNGLIDQKQISVTEITAKVASLLPPGVRLTGLAMSRKDTAAEPAVSIAVEATSEPAIEKFLDNLASSPDFPDSAVGRQSYSDKAGAPRGSGGLIALTCTARYKTWQSR